MGPEATLLLMQKVLDAVPAEDDADHIPLIVHQNPQVPSRIAALIEGKNVDPAPVLAQMARDLKAAGAEALALPCNTAHHYAGVIEAATDLGFLHMPRLAAKRLEKIGAKRVGVLASPAARLVRVFEPEFEPRGLCVEYPKNDGKVLTLIRTVKSGVRPASELLLAEARALMDDCCDHVLIACTELSLLSGTLPTSLPWCDSIDCLVDAIVAFATDRQDREVPVPAA